jgi:hypothetical protein
MAYTLTSCDLDSKIIMHIMIHIPQINASTLMIFTHTHMCMRAWILNAPPLRAV